MNAFAYLTRPDPELTAEEEDALSLELSTAYRMDEAAASSAEVRYIAEKVRARMERGDAEEAASTSGS